MQTCGRCREAKDEMEFSPSYRGKAGTWCRLCFADYNRKRSRGITPGYSVGNTQQKVCGHCEQIFTPKLARERTVYCSRACKESARQAVLRAEREASKPTRQCLHCGHDMPQAMRADAKFCTEECNSAAHAVTRKMAKRAARSRTPGDPLIDRNAIAARDNYRCQLCGGKVDMKRKHPDPLCASIDHVVPLARGGTNDLANLQLAHLQCNLRKRAEVITAEQLRLIG